MQNEPDVAGYDLQFRRMGGAERVSLPGNIIVVTDELVKFVHSDDELLAVLAHEIGHLRARHALRLVLQQSGIAVLATVVAGDAVGDDDPRRRRPRHAARRPLFPRLRGRSR